MFARKTLFLNDDAGARSDALPCILRQDAGAAEAGANSSHLHHLRRHIPGRTTPVLSFCVSKSNFGLRPSGYVAAANGRITIPSRKRSPQLLFVGSDSILPQRCSALMYGNLWYRLLQLAAGLNERCGLRRDLCYQEQHHFFRDS